MIVDDYVEEGGGAKGEEGGGADLIKLYLVRAAKINSNDTFR